MQRTLEAGNEMNAHRTIAQLASLTFILRRPRAAAWQGPATTAPSSSAVVRSSTPAPRSSAVEVDSYRGWGCADRASHAGEGFAGASRCRTARQGGFCAMQQQRDRHGSVSDPSLLTIYRLTVVVDHWPARLTPARIARCCCCCSSCIHGCPQRVGHMGWPPVTVQTSAVFCGLSLRRRRDSGLWTMGAGGDGSTSLLLKER